MMQKFIIIIKYKNPHMTHKNPPWSVSRQGAAVTVKNLLDNHAGKVVYVGVNFETGYKNLHHVSRSQTV